MNLEILLTPKSVAKKKKKSIVGQTVVDSRGREYVVQPNGEWRRKRPKGLSKRLRAKIRRDKKKAAL